MRYIEEKIKNRPFRAYLPTATERSHYRGKRPAVVIFPGGGYAFTYEGEAEPIALRFAAEGIPAFVLDYTCADSAREVYPKPMIEAFAAIRFVREHAEEYGIDPHNIASLGFSAGGHLCGCTGTLWNKPIAKDWVGEKPELSRPDKLILCYAVLKAEPPTHKGSFDNLLGEGAAWEDARLPLLDAVKNVDGETPESFLWSTAADTAVPAVNTLDFARALAERGVPFELHIWRHGEHGLCLGNQVTQDQPFGQDDEVSEWMREAIKFMYQK